MNLAPGIQPIKVLVAEDSKAARMLLVHILRSDPAIGVIGEVASGLDALEFLAGNSPDVILMDIEMPRMDGLEATRRIMQTQPIPIVICSASANTRQALTTVRSLEAGALACVEKPVGLAHPDFSAMAAHLLRTVKLMSEVKVVRRWPRPYPGTARCAQNWSLPILTTPVEVIGIGVSTGGPPVLRGILGALPRDFAVPLLIVQHISRGFVAGMAEWLGQTTGMGVQVAAHGIRPHPGQAYLAADDCHMIVTPGGRIALSNDEPDNGLRPSVAHLFDSIAEVHGPAGVGVLLTGMGKDGARELKKIKACGGFTVAQDKETSVVHGMPGEAIAIGAAMRVVPADQIATMLVDLTRRPFFSGARHEYSRTRV